MIQSFLRHAVRDGFFHADMHQGNLFVDADGRLTAVDFGIMGRLGLKERRFLAEILYGFIRRDYRRIAEVHFEAGYVPRIHKVEDFAQAIRAIGEPIHSRTADEISMAKLLTLLFEITGLFDMKTRTELVLLQKTMVVVEGVARTLDPKLNMWATAEPVVRAWIEQNLGPVGKLQDAGRAAQTLGRFAAGLPAALLRAEGVLTQLEVIAEEGVELSEGAIVSHRRSVGARRAARPYRAMDPRRDRPRAAAATLKSPSGKQGAVRPQRALHRNRSRSSFRIDASRNRRDLSVFPRWARQPEFNLKVADLPFR